MNHEFWYKYHQNRLQNREVMGIWPTFSRHFEYLISFQNLFNCLIFSYQYYHNICVSADMQLYTHKENVLLKIIANNPLVCLLF